MTVAPRVVHMPGGVRTEIHLAGEDTAGAFCLLVDEPPPGWSLPPHSHANEAETIHVLSGELEVDVDGRPARLAAGDTIHVPQGARHATRNVGAGSVRRVVVFSPAGLERFFLEVGTPSPDTTAQPQDALAAALRHGWRFAP